MKIIATTALAIALSAFGARAQTTTNDNPNNSATPPTSGSAATGEDKGTAGISNPQAGSTSTLPSTSTPGAPGDTSSGDVSAKTNGSGSSISGNTSSDTSDETTTTVKKHHKKHSKKQAAPQGRSDTSSMHRARPSDSPALPADKGDSAKSDDSLKGDTSGSVERPAAPSTTTPDTGTTTAPKDPGMSKPGDVIGQPTDTQKPVDQPSNPPDKK